MFFFFLGGGGGGSGLGNTYWCNVGNIWKLFGLFYKAGMCLEQTLVEEMSRNLPHNSF